MGGRILRAGWKLASISKLPSPSDLSTRLVAVTWGAAHSMPSVLSSSANFSPSLFIPFLNICSPNVRPFDLLGKGERF